jgi:DNA-binding NtrC family response regulator
VAALIAVVHNDSDMRELMVLTLRAAGHSAVGIEDPLRALETIEADSCFRALVTGFDFGSGKLNGVALARMLRLARPGFKIVFVGSPENAEHAERIGEFLPLPLDVDHLVHIVSSFLPEASSTDEPRKRRSPRRASEMLIWTDTKAARP